MPEEQYRRPVRTVNGPVILVGRRMRLRPVDGKYRELPMNSIPVEKRTGMLHILYIPETLRISGPEQDKTYPHGAHYRYDEMVKRPPYTGSWSRMRRLADRHTPLLASREVDVHYSGSSTSTDEHLTLISPRQLPQYLRGVLPYIGMDARDIRSITQYVESLLERGRRELNSRR
jgi:hypothetical protein